MDNHSMTKWAYSGFWGMLTKWFLLPKTPPTLPQQENEEIISFQPSIAWLNYNKFHFWVLLLIIDIAVLTAWVALLWHNSFWGWTLSPLFLFVGIAPDILAYLVIYLKYDSTWYVLSDRSLRIRRGLWTIEDITVTFANIQNIKLAQGPLERYFGFSNLIIETAGGGGGQTPGAEGMQAHKAVLAGINNAKEIRELLLEKLKNKNLGKLVQDNMEESSSPSTTNLSPAHIDLLREIRNELKIQIEK